MSTKLIDPEQDTVYTCMYRIGLLIFSVGSENIQMDQSNVLSIEKMDNCEYNLRSIIKLSLQLDTRQKAWIMKNKSNITCKFELDKFGMDTDMEKEIVGDQMVWNTEFAVFLNDDDANADAQSMEESLASNEGDEFQANNIEEQGYFTGQDTFDVYLYNNELIKASKFNINQVGSSGLLQTAVNSILSQSGHKNVLMSTIENTEVKNELLVPSNPAYKALVYLDQYYGLYKRGASIFYDYDCLYIINPNGKETATRDGEWPETHFLVSTKSESSPGNGMVMKPNQQVYYANIPEESIQPQNLSESKSAQYGSTIQMVTTDDVKVENTPTNDSNDSSNKYKAFQNSSDNQFATDTIKARMEENDAIMYITADNLDINAFTINKMFCITYEDQAKHDRYSKNRYRIAYATHRMVQQSTYMKSSHQIALKKCSED